MNGESAQGDAHSVPEIADAKMQHQRHDGSGRVTTAARAYDHGARDSAQPKRQQRPPENERDPRWRPLWNVALVVLLGPLALVRDLAPFVLRAGQDAEQRRLEAECVHERHVRRERHPHRRKADQRRIDRREEPKQEGHLRGETHGVLGERHPVHPAVGARFFPARAERCEFAAAQEQGGRPRPQRRRRSNSSGDERRRRAG
mmetsp:Transcript_38446/g.106091  ORF Transcript_38446/g.106091 Transcript_38446/m.106091 type:complete len:202 (-) Transcript_38446:158-763(-)|eukprot:2660805-Prymnesium_polylepis.1